MGYKMSKIRVIFFVLIAFLLISNPVINASEENTSTISAQIEKVDHIANIRERLFERITLFFKFSPAEKVNYQKILAEKRLAELQYVIDSKKGDLIEETSSRYSTYLGRLTQQLTSSKLVSKKDEILKMLDLHSQVIEELTAKIDRDSGFWLLLQHNTNTIKLLSDQIKNLK